MSARAAALALLAAALLAGCGVELRREHPLACASDEQRLVRETLYFGAGIPGGGEVDDGAWSRFAADAITPAFPQGYTTIDAHGNWRGQDSATRAERSRIVVIVHTDDAPANAAVRELARRYREQFHQEAVLRERTAACAAF